MSAQQKSGILLESGSNEVEFLRFGLRGQMYGVNVAKVRQVMVYDGSKVMELPRSNEAILGQFCFRGDPIAVIDLAVHLKGAAPEPERRLFLVCEFNLVTVAFVVDEVDRIVRCTWQQFRPMEHTPLTQKSAAVVGTVVRDEDMMAIIDVEAVLSELVPSAGIEAAVVSDEVKNSRALDRGSLRVVYCEDSSVVQKVLVNCLRGAGYKNIRLFNNGQEGLEYLQSEAGKETDLVISDIEMPMMDGLTLCKRLRELSHGKDIPFVFFSSMVSDDMRRKCQGVGGNRSFSKPELSSIVQGIDELILGNEI